MDSLQVVKPSDRREPDQRVDTSLPIPAYHGPPKCSATVLGKIHAPEDTLPALCYTLDIDGLRQGIGLKRTARGSVALELGTHARRTLVPMVYPRFGNQPYYRIGEKGFTVCWACVEALGADGRDVLVRPDYPADSYTIEETVRGLPFTVLIDVPRGESIGGKWRGHILKDMAAAAPDGANLIAGRASQSLVALRDGDAVDVLFENGLVWCLERNGNELSIRELESHNVFAVRLRHLVEVITSKTNAEWCSNIGVERFRRVLETALITLLITYRDEAEQFEQLTKALTQTLKEHLSHSFRAGRLRHVLSEFVEEGILEQGEFDDLIRELL